MGRCRGARSMRRSSHQPLDRAWQAMRILRTFTAPQICAAAEVHRISLARYIGGLRRTGYLIKTGNGCASRREPATYQLIRNSGPYRPHLQINGQVYDRNIGQKFIPEGK